VILLTDKPPSAGTLAKLAEYQSEVNKSAVFAERVKEAKRLFPNRNKPANPVFAEVRRKLTEMCFGAMRCVYCEDSARDQVEHIAPKDWYPEVVFAWENYVYACGRCNRPKNNKYAVFSKTTGARTDLKRGKNDPVLPPETGDPLLLNPRNDDAMQYMQLDLAGTFIFVETGAEHTPGQQRAAYTIEILGLNDREELPVARLQAYGNYKARLQEYVVKKNAHAPQAELDKLRDGLMTSNHPTVWREMVRQRDGIPELAPLFAQAPEAALWV